MIWDVYTTFFSEVLSRNNYISMLDTLVCFPETPELVAFQVAAFIVHNAGLLGNIKAANEIKVFLSTESNEDIDRLLRLIHNLHSKHKDSVRTNFHQPCVSGRGYQPFLVCSREAVRNERGRRLAEERTYAQKQEEEYYRVQRAQETETRLKEEKEDQDKRLIFEEGKRFRESQHLRRKEEMGKSQQILTNTQFRLQGLEREREEKALE